MNKDFIRINDKAIIEDFDGEKRIEKYHDNLEDELLKENRIEIIERKIDTVKQKNVGMEDSDILSKIFTYILGGIVWGALIGIHNHLNINNSGLITGVVIGIEVIYALFSVGYIASDISMFREKRNQELGLEVELAFLNKELALEKENLEKIALEKERNIHTNSEEQNIIAMKKLDNETIIHDLKEQQDFFHDCGYNGLYYYHFYKKGVLDKLLDDNYTVAEIENIEEFFRVNVDFFENKLSEKKESILSRIRREK